MASLGAKRTKSGCCDGPAAVVSTDSDLQGPYPESPSRRRIAVVGRFLGNLIAISWIGVILGLLTGQTKDGGTTAGAVGLLLGVSVMYLVVHFSCKDRGISSELELEPHSGAKLILTAIVQPKGLWVLVLFLTSFYLGANVGVALREGLFSPKGSPLLLPLYNDTLEITDLRVRLKYATSQDVLSIVRSTDNRGLNDLANRFADNPEQLLKECRRYMGLSPE